MKLSEALIKQKRLKNKADDMLFRIEKIENITLPDIKKDLKEKEQQKAGKLLADYRVIMQELIRMKKAVQIAGFRSGIKDKLIELEELKGYLAILRNLNSKGPMGEQFWESIESTSYDRSDRITVQNFWPVDQEELEKEKILVSAKIEEMDIFIQKKNWEVDIEF